MNQIMGLQYLPSRNLKISHKKQNEASKKDKMNLLVRLMCKVS